MPLLLPQSDLVFVVQYVVAGQRSLSHLGKVRRWLRIVHRQWPPRRSDLHPVVAERPVSPDHRALAFGTRPPHRRFISVPTLVVLWYSPEFGAEAPPYVDGDFAQLDHR